MPEDIKSRIEAFLAEIAGATGVELPEPQSRIEEWLAYIAENGGGGGGDLPETTSLIKGDGAGGAIPAVPGTDYAEPSDIPTSLADLASDATHRTVTDEEKQTWNTPQILTEVNGVLTLTAAPTYDGGVE